METALSGMWQCRSIDDADERGDDDEQVRAGQLREQWNTEDAFDQVHLTRITLPRILDEVV